MAKGAYVGVGNVARRVKSAYVGIGGVARKVTKAYVGVNDVARLWWTLEIDGERVVQVAAGANHSLFLASSGKVYSCGQNAQGQLGRAVATGNVSNVNLGLIEGLPPVSKIVAGSVHSLFLTSSGQVYSCGSSAQGQLGRAVAAGSETVVNLGMIEGLSGVEQLSTFFNFNLFLTSSGQIYSCGQNTAGQLGRAVPTGNATTVNLGMIEGLSGIAKIRAGSGHSLFLTSSGQVYSCGSSAQGQLGRAVAAGSETVVNLGMIEGLSGVVDMSAYNYSLFLTSSGQVYSCGYNPQGQLGRAVPTGNATTVNLGMIEGLSGIAKIRAGSGHSLFLTSSGQVYNCGQNTAGQLGRAVAAGSVSNVNLGLIEGLPPVSKIDAGGTHSLFLTSSDQIYSCGLNTAGQLGRAVEAGSETVVNLGLIDYPFVA